MVLVHERDGEERRRALLEVVTASPGIHKSELARVTNLSWGTVNFHLRRMLADGLVRVERSGRLARFFPPHIRGLEAAAHELRVSGSMRLLQLLGTRGPMGVTVLSRTSGSGDRFVRARLAMLERMGVISAGAQYHRRFSITSEGIDLLRLVASEPATEAVNVPLLTTST